MVSLPDYSALPTRVAASCQMQYEVVRKIINITDRQARTYLRHVNECAPFEKVTRHSLDPSWLIGRSPKEQTTIEKMRGH